MPLTVDEVGAAPGLARSRLPRPGVQVSSRRLSAGGPLRAAGNPGWNITFQTRRLEGEEAEYLPFPLVTPAGEGGVGWGGGLQVGSLEAPRNQTAGDHNAPKGAGAPPPSN